MNISRYTADNLKLDLNKLRANSDSELMTTHSKKWIKVKLLGNRCLCQPERNLSDYESEIFTYGELNDLIMPF